MSKRKVQSLSALVAGCDMIQTILKERDDKSDKKEEMSQDEVSSILDHLGGIYGTFVEDTKLSDGLINKIKRYEAKCEEYKKAPNKIRKYAAIRLPALRYHFGNKDKSLQPRYNAELSNLEAIACGEGPLPVPRHLKITIRDRDRNFGASPWKSTELSDISAGTHIIKHPCSPHQRAFQLLARYIHIKTFSNCDETLSRSGCEEKDDEQTKQDKINHLAQSVQEDINCHVRTHHLPILDLKNEVSNKIPFSLGDLLLSYHVLASECHFQFKLALQHLKPSKRQFGSPWSEQELSEIALQGHTYKAVNIPQYYAFEWLARYILIMEFPKCENVVGNAGCRPEDDEKTIKEKVNQFADETKQEAKDLQIVAKDIMDELDYKIVGSLADLVISYPQHATAFHPEFTKVLDLLYQECTKALTDLKSEDKEKRENAIRHIHECVKPPCNEFRKQDKDELKINCTNDNQYEWEIKCTGCNRYIGDKYVPQDRTECEDCKKLFCVGSKMGEGRTGCVLNDCQECQQDVCDDCWKTHKCVNKE